MKRSDGRILTTHVGSLPRPDDLVGLYGQDAPESKLLPRLKSAVADVVRQQTAAGIDVVNDGEFGKPMPVTALEEQFLAATAEKVLESGHAA